jgi:hypothetical protein
MTSISFDAAPPLAPSRPDPDSKFVLAEEAPGEAPSEGRRQRPLWNEDGARAVEGMRPQQLVARQAPDDPYLRGLAAPPRGLPAEAHEGFERFRWMSSELVPGVSVGADHMPGGSRIGMTTTGSALPDGGWSGLVVTQPHGPDDHAARLRAQIGGRADFDLPGDLRGALEGNAAFTTGSGASAHADLSVTTGGGTGIGASVTAGADGVAHEVYLRQQIAENAALSGRLISPVDGDTEFRLRYDSADLRAEAFTRDGEWGAGVNLRMRW